MALTVLELDSKQYLSYASIAEADEYIAGDLRYSTAWAAIADDAKGVKERALIFATRRIDRRSFSGERTEGLPRLRFPDTDPDTDESALDETNSLAVTTQFPRDGSAEVPAAVAEACILEAAYLIANPSATAAVPASDGPQRKKVQAGRNSIEYFRGEQAEAPALRVQEPGVAALLAPFLSAGSASLGDSVVSRTLDRQPREGVLA